MIEFLKTYMGLQQQINTSCYNLLMFHSPVLFFLYFFFAIQSSVFLFFKKEILIPGQYASIGLERIGHD